MITFRKAEIMDINELVRLRIEFLTLLNKDFKCTADFSDELFNYFNENMKMDKFTAWIAFDAAKIVGTSGICFYTLPPSVTNFTGKTAYIMNMYTMEQYRNKGIASKLFEKVVYEAKSRGCKKIYLHATESGRPLYKKFGFKETNNEMVYDTDLLRM